MSVRKRVIKILKDICVLQPDFPQISDICVRMIKRISDEEGIKVRLICCGYHVHACARDKTISSAVLRFRALNKF